MYMISYLKDDIDTGSLEDSFEALMNYPAAAVLILLAAILAAFAGYVLTGKKHE